MKKSRSNTPPPPAQASSKSRRNNNPTNNSNQTESEMMMEQQQYPHRVQFSPISSAPRRGSSSTCSSSGGSSKSQSNNTPHAKLQTKESIDREKQRRLDMVKKRAKERREKMLKRVRKEKKIMLFSSLFAFLALFLWFVAVFTGHWFYLRQTDENIERSLNSTNLDEEIFIVSNTGLWRTCSDYMSVRDAEIRVECSYFSIFLTSREQENRDNPTSLNEHVVDYTRAQICFAFISVLLMIMTIVAAFYTFKNSRYVYKRLASCLYYMTAITILVVLEVLMTSVNYAEGAKLYPEGAVVQYGFSFYLGWSVFLVYLVNGCIFLILSRKRKDLKDEDLDGEVIMGR